MILYSRKQMIEAWFQIRTTCWTFQDNPPEALQEFWNQALSHTGRTPFISICGNFFFMAALKLFQCDTICISTECCSLVDEVYQQHTFIVLKTWWLSHYQQTLQPWTLIMGTLHFLTPYLNILSLEYGDKHASSPWQCIPQTCSHK